MISYNPQDNTELNSEAFASSGFSPPLVKFPFPRPQELSNPSDFRGVPGGQRLHPQLSQVVWKRLTTAPKRESFCPLLLPPWEQGKVQPENPHLRH